MEKNKELTPMMELIEEFDNFKYQNRLTDKDFEDAGFNDLLNYAKSLLPKEKQGYEDAYYAGTWQDITAETYYNTKYNNQIK